MSSQISVTVEPNTKAVMDALIKCVADVKAAVASGGSAAVEGVKIGTALVTDLFPVIGVINTLPAEAKEDIWAFSRTCLLDAENLAQVLVGGAEKL